MIIPTANPRINDRDLLIFVSLIELKLQQFVK
jgi:hypothetical protein